MGSNVLKAFRRAVDGRWAVLIMNESHVRVKEEVESEAEETRAEERRMG